MKVYVIRHGESETNAAKRWTGWYDVNLTEAGKNDARKVGEFLKNVSFDKVFASDLKRAVQTANNAVHNCCPEKSALLREIDVGNLAGKPLDCLTNEQREQVAKKGYSEFGGESRADFCARVDKFKSQLETLDCDNVALFCHAGWVRTMLDIVVGMCLPRKSICCNNCAVAIFEYSDKEWKLYSWINL